MDFLFFTAAGTVSFTRSDAESANWAVEEMSLQALFPYDPQKVINRGLRIGFTDFEGKAQIFEIRKVRTYEPDHYQEITAEHIAISELTDEHTGNADFENVTAGAVLAALLTGTLWSVGTDTASNTSTGSVTMGSVWQAFQTVQGNWNVYLTPRVTVNANGITGRYIDIRPAGGSWGGMRLSLDKNADEIGVTWEDTNVKTALYGYGALVEGSGNDKEILTFASVEWTATDDHPAKPLNQTYLEDPIAKALYGRNGRNRFGFYQNGDITDPDILLQKTWEVLQTVNVPDVSIDCMVRDLHRLGYADEPIRLHDTAIIEIRPTGVSLQKEIIKLSVDLLDPTASRVTIGAYIPNIVYINKETNDAATGGGGGGSGTKAQGAQTPKEFETMLEFNDYRIDLTAVQYVSAGSAEILRKAGLSLNAQGVLIYADDVPNMIGAKINVEKDRITQIVQAVGSNGQVTAASIALAINENGSNATITADHIYLYGTTSASDFFASDGTVASAFINSLTCTEITSEEIRAELGTIVLGSTGASWQAKQMVTSITMTDGTARDFEDTAGNTHHGFIVSSFTREWIYYVGRIPE